MQPRASPAEVRQACWESGLRDRGGSRAASPGRYLYLLPQEPGEDPPAHAKRMRRGPLLRWGGAGVPQALAAGPIPLTHVGSDSKVRVGCDQLAGWLVGPRQSNMWVRNQPGEDMVQGLGEGTQAPSTPPAPPASTQCPSKL